MPKDASIFQALPLWLCAHLLPTSASSDEAPRKPTAACWEEASPRVVPATPAPAGFSLSPTLPGWASRCLRFGRSLFIRLKLFLSPRQTVASFPALLPYCLRPPQVPRVPAWSFLFLPPGLSRAPSLHEPFIELKRHTYPMSRTVKGLPQYCGCWQKT